MATERSVSQAESKLSGGEGGGGDGQTEKKGASASQVESNALGAKGAIPDPCGLADDGIEWKEYVPPPRKRITEATPDQQRRLLTILNKIFAKESIIGQRVNFNPNDVIWICRMVYDYLKSEPSFIEDVQPPITVVGDLFGQLHDLDRLFKCRSRDGKAGYLCAKYLFLGNYVDRGRQSVEVIMALFILKIIYPDNFILLRGNHEFLSVNIKFGLADECKKRFTPKGAEAVYAMLNSAFAALSICAIIGGKAFCVHGGISTTAFTRTSLRNLRKPCLSNVESMLVHDMVWSDPADGLQGTCFNSARQTSVYFGENYFANCMYNIDCLYMIRGHSVISEGFQAVWDRVFTIFSCTAMNYKRNHGAFIMLDKNMKMTIGIMPIDEERLAIELEILGKTKGDNDEVTQAGDEPGTGKITVMRRS